MQRGRSFKCYRVNNHLGFVIGSQTGFTSGTSSSTLFKTDDGGQTLHSIFETSWQINDIYAVNEEVLYIVGEDHSFLGNASDNGFVAKSVNGGESFVFLHQNLAFDIGFLHHTGEENFLFAGTHTIGRVTNGGQTITSNPVDYFSVRRMSVTDDGHVFFLAWDTSVDKTTIVKTNNMGQILSIHYTKEYFDDFHFDNATNGWAINNNKFFSTQNGGQTWELKTYIGGAMETIEFQNGTKVWAGGYNDGVYTYDDVTPTREILATDREIKIWPNPVADQLHVEWPNEEPFVAQLSNATGQNLAFWKLDGGETSLNLPLLSTGVYWLKFTTPNGEILTRKLIKTE